MKTVVHENIDIEDFPRFFTALKREHPEVSGAEWNNEKRILKVFYQDGTRELTDKAIKTFKTPTILRFKKKIDVPIISNATVTAINENEFTVETHDVESVRKEVKKTFSEFEEVTP